MGVRAAPTMTMGSSGDMVEGRSIQRGAMRSAPSRRMVSPLSMVFSQMCLTSAANSAGRPSRGGKGTLLPSASCTSGEKPAIIGVSKIPGAMVTTRMPKRASSRAMGSVRATTPPFGGGVGGLADLAIEGSDGGGVDDDAALAVVAGVLFGDGRGGEADHIEGADEIDVDGARKGVEAMRTVAADDSLGGSDSGAVDESVQMAKGAEREIDGGLGVVLAGDVGEGEAGGGAELGGQGFAGCAIGVGDDDGGAFSDEHPRGGCTEPRCAAGYEEDVVRDLH